MEGNIMPPVLEILSAHRSIRKFTDRPVDADLLTSLISAAQCTSTSHHAQACYGKRASKLRDRTWTRQMADFTGQVIRPHMKAFLRKKIFSLK
jgi:nitroreductase